MSVQYTDTLNTLNSNVDKQSLFEEIVVGSVLDYIIHKSIHYSVLYTTYYIYILDMSV